MYWILIIGAMAASGFVGMMLKRRFKEYSQLSITLSGKEVAEKMLSENGITDVEVTHVPGMLTDHYNPQKKTVNLSEAVYATHNVASAAVAAHECGHAIQHAKAYAPLKMRSALVPVCTIGSKLTPWLLMGGIAMLSTGSSFVLLLGIIAFSLTTLFTFITLPVEFDASNRALGWLEGAGMMGSAEHTKAKSALKWAALTYVVAALASLGQLLYYVMIFANSRR